MKRGPYKKRVNATAEPAEKPPSNIVLTERNVGGKFTDRIRLVISGYKKPFTRADVQEDMAQRWPDDEPMKSKLPSLSVYLIDMVERGELTRKGIGRDTVFTTDRLRPARMPKDRPRNVAAAVAQENYESIRKGIEVPRNADAEES